MEKSNNEKARGFAFLEFEAYDRMKTCLKLYHHSSFDDGKSPARRINVELTYVFSFLPPLPQNGMKLIMDDTVLEVEAPNPLRGRRS